MVSAAGDLEFKPLKRLEHKRAVAFMAIDPRGEFLASIDLAGQLLITDLGDAALRVVDQQSLAVAPRWSPLLAWSPDGQLLAVAGADEIKLVRRAGWATWKRYPTAEHHRATTGLCWAQDGSFFVSHDAGTLCVWSLLRAIAPHGRVACEKGVVCAALSPAAAELSFIDCDGVLHRQREFLSRAELAGLRQEAAEAQQPADAPRPVAAEGPKKRARELKALKNKYLLDEAAGDEDGSAADDGDDNDDDDDEGGEVDLDNTSGGDSGAEEDYDSLDDYDVDAKEDAAMDAVFGEAAGALPGSAPAAPQHPPFQPGATDAAQEHRYMCWNAVGIVTGRRDEAGYQSVDIEFHDKAGTRPVRFIDDHGFGLGTLSRTAALFAAAAKPGVHAVLHYMAFETWSGRQTWTVHLEEGEDVVALAVDERFAYVATSHGWLRVFTPTGLQCPIVTLPGDVVTMVAGAERLLLVSASQGHLHTQLYGVRECVPVLVFEGPLGRRASAAGLAWAGVSEDGRLVTCFDRTGILYALCDRLGYCWTPIGDLGARLRAGDYVWPLFADRAELTCLVGAGGPQPPVLPRPIPAGLALRLPLVQPEDPQTAAYEPILRTAVFTRLLDGTAGMREKDVRRMQTQSDKHALEMIHLAIKADRHVRALELCGLLYSSRSLELAVQLARHSRLASLADRMEALGPGLAASASPAAVCDTPRLPLRMQRESPSLVLASLTPQGRAAGDLRGAVDDFGESPGRAAASPSAARSLKRSKLDLVAAEHGLAEEPTELPAAGGDEGPAAQPDAPQPVTESERKPRGLMDMLSRLGSLTCGPEASEEPKAKRPAAPGVPAAAGPAPAKENQAPGKSLKQVNLQAMFGRKSSLLEAAPGQPGAEDAETQME